MRRTIQDLLIVEKRISQIQSKIEITFSFDIIKTNHAEDRSNVSKRGLEGNQTHISNAEMSEFVSSFRRDIAEAIVDEQIKNGTEFVIKSLDKELSMAIVANQVVGLYWKLIIKTVFRESQENSLKTAKDQLVFEK